MADRLLLVERKGHVAQALEHARRRGAPVTILALSPEVMAALEAAGASFKIPEDYLDRAALNRRGLENYGHLERCGAWLDGRLQALAEPLRLNPVFLHFYRLKRLIDSVGFRIEELSAVLKAEQPREAVVFRYDDDPLWNGPHALHAMTDDGPIYAEVAAYIGQALKVPIRVEHVPGRAAPGETGIAGRARRLAGGARRLLRLALGRFLPAGGKPSLWQVGDLAHDVPELLPLLARRFRVEKWENALHGPLGARIARAWGGRDELLGSRGDLRAFWEAGLRELSAQPLFEYAGVNAFPLLAPALEALFVDEHLEASSLYRGLRRLIRRAPPRAALTILSPMYSNVLAAWALLAEGIPVVFAQEGGPAGYCEAAIHQYCDMAWGSHLLAYGPGAAAYLNTARLSARQRAEAVPCGSLRLGRLKAAGAPAAPARIATVMYVPGAFHHCLRYAPLLYGEREYFLQRRRILEALLSVGGLKIIYKASPGTLGRDALSAFLAEHRERIEALDEPLTRVLCRADAFVADWPITTLLELVATGRPVWALLDRDVTRPVEGALPALRKRVNVSLDLDSFERELRGLASSSAKPPDEEFLGAYGTGGSAAWSCDDIAGFFDGLTKRKP